MRHWKKRGKQMSEIKSMVEKINEEDDIRKIGDILTEIHEELTSIVLQGINIDKLARKVESTDGLSEISYFLERTGERWGRFKKELEDKLDFSVIGEKVRKSPSVGTLLLFDKFSEMLVIDLLKNFSLDDLAHELNIRVSTWGIGLTLKMIKEKSFSTARNIVEKLDVNKISEKISKDSNLWGITLCLREILAIDPKKWEILLEKLDLPILVKKLERSNVTEIQRLLAVVSVNEKVGRQLIHSLDLEKLARKVDEGTNMLFIVHLLGTLIELDEEVGRDLVQRIDLKNLFRKIKEEPQLFEKSIFRMLPLEKE